MGCLIPDIFESLFFFVGAYYALTLMQEVMLEGKPAMMMLLSHKCGL